MSERSKGEAGNSGIHIRGYPGGLWEFIELILALPVDLSGQPPYANTRLPSWEILCREYVQVVVGRLGIRMQGFALAFRLVG